MGRNKKEVRDARITFSLPPDEEQKLRAEASDRNMELSALIRERIVKNKFDDDTDPVQEIMKRLDELGREIHNITQAQESTLKALIDNQARIIEIPPPPHVNASSEPTTEETDKIESDPAEITQQREEQKENRVEKVTNATREELFTLGSRFGSYRDTYCSANNIKPNEALKVITTEFSDYLKSEGVKNYKISLKECITCGTGKDVKNISRDKHDRIVKCLDHFEQKEEHG